MITRNHRVVFYVTDYVEFTGESQYALNGCDVDNNLGPSVDDEANAMAWERSMFTNAEAIKAKDKSSQKFFLMSMATGVPSAQMVMAFTIRFLPSLNSHKAETAECAKAFNIPGLAWCPESLLDIAQLENYYKQITLEEAIQSALTQSSTSTTMGFPNAIYLNGVDIDGTIRTGTEVLWGATRVSTDSKHYTTAYAYVDTLVLYNIILGCNNLSEDAETAAECAALKTTYINRRAKHPLTLWSDETVGRKINWP